MSDFWNKWVVIQNFGKDSTSRDAGFLDNDGIRPVHIKDRTWRRTTYSVFWFSAVATTANWYATSSGITAGLTIWECLGCYFGGQLVAGCLIALNGRAGAIYHVPFPIVCRSSFGAFGSLWPTFNRAVMSIVWTGVNMVQGAQCL
jgi:nucleobase:cation symporter-1, NCS1 family